MKKYKYYVRFGIFQTFHEKFDEFSQNIFKNKYGYIF